MREALLYNDALFCAVLFGAPAVAALLTMVLVPLLERYNPDTPPEPREVALPTRYRGWAIVYLRPGFEARKPIGVPGWESTVEGPTLRSVFTAIDAVEEMQRCRP